MRRADLVADDLVDPLLDPAELAEEGLPGPDAQLDAVREHGRRVGRGELEELVRRQRAERLDAPAAEAVELGRRLGRPRRAACAASAGERAVGQEHGDGPRAAGERGQRELEELHAPVLAHPLDHDVVDLARRLARDDQPRPDLAQLDPVGDLDHAVEHARGRRC